MTSRTQKEILAKIDEWENQDWMGTKRSDLIDYLSFENAKQYLKEGVTEKEWTERDLLTPAEEIEKYMEFAWDKANNFRGISAGRSLEHMMAWLWLDGQDEFLKENDINNYEYYGKPQLVAICELYGLDSKKWDDGVRSNSEEY